MIHGAAFTVGLAHVQPGESVDLTLKVSENYCGSPIHLPLHVVRGARPGPAVFVAGAIHGDELNGTGIVRALIVKNPPALESGTLVLLPVVNMLGFERHSRYMPDRRDLNRSFPGSRHGSLAARLAHAVFDGIVRQCQYGIDLHTAANVRTNIPNVRADLSLPPAREIAEAFGCELVINSRGPRASLRRAACDIGCAVIALEAGEPWKIEPGVVKLGTRGIHNVLTSLGMIDGQLTRPHNQIIVHRTVWLRAAEAGLLHFHVSPGESVHSGQLIATNASLLGRHTSVIRATASGIVIGMTTLPAVKPGDPVCHLAFPEIAPRSRHA